MIRVPDGSRRPARGVAAFLLLLAATMLGAGPAAARVLVPMDLSQTDHLRAYGLTYWALERGLHGEWLLNYRGGSFLLPDDPASPGEAAIRRAEIHQGSEAALGPIYHELADKNIEGI